MKNTAIDLPDNPISFRTFTGGFEVLVDVGKSEPISTIVLSFPNKTQVTISGDSDVVKQIVDRLDGLGIEYVDSSLEGDEKC